MTGRSRIGRYELLTRVGRGGMAEVFVAIHGGAAGFERPVCVKRILPNLAADSVFRDLFVREARTTGYLCHSNIVQVFDCIEEGDDLAIVMELVDGMDLRNLATQLWLRGGRLDETVVAYVAGQVLMALRFAHAKRVVHRDVSPHNLLVSRQGEVKLADFGVAKAMLTHATRTGDLKGKLAYMSPEQAHGAPVDHRTDLYSLGLVLFELLTGRKYFEGKNQAELFQAVSNATRPKLEGVSSELAELVETLLAPDPADRFDSAEEALLVVPTWKQAGPVGAIELSLVVAELDVPVTLPEMEPSSTSSRGADEGQGASLDAPNASGDTELLSDRRPRPPERPVVPASRNAPTATREDDVAKAIGLAPTARYTPVALDDELDGATLVRTPGGSSPRGGEGGREGSRKLWVVVLVAVLLLLATVVGLGVGAYVMWSRGAGVRAPASTAPASTAPPPAGPPPPPQGAISPLSAMREDVRAADVARDASVAERASAGGRGESAERGPRN